MSILDDIFVRGALVGLGVSLSAGPLGCFVVWRRMAYFGDATAHAAMMGVALSLALSLPVFIGAQIVALLMAIAVTTLSGQNHTSDTLLGVLAHSALAVGVVAVTFLPGVQLDLMGYLFGDILAVRRIDLAIIWGGALLVTGLMVWRWQALLVSTLNADLAYAAGLDPKREELILTLALATVVAVAIKLVGVLLIGALLIIPAAVARPFATTPERMAIGAVAVGGISALGGLQVSASFDTPAGPSIVCVAAVLFGLSVVLRPLLGRA